MEQQSKIEDLDFSEAISNQKKQQTLQEYALMMQRKRQEQEAKTVQNLFG